MNCEILGLRGMLVDEAKKPSKENPTKFPQLVRWVFPLPVQGWDFFHPPKKVGVKQPQLTH